MTDVGEPKDFVDTQDVSLTNSNDNKTYLQLTDVTFELDSNVEKNQLTDDTVENVYSLNMNSIEGNMIVTTSEWLDLINLTLETNGQRPTKLWIVGWKNATLSTTLNTSFSGQIKTLRPIDVGLGSVTLFFRIEATHAFSVGVV